MNGKHVFIGVAVGALTYCTIMISSWAFDIVSVDAMVAFDNAGSHSKMMVAVALGSLFVGGGLGHLFTKVQNAFK